MSCSCLFPDQEKATPGDEVLRKSIEHFAKLRGISSIRECSPSRDSHKRVFWLGESLIAKTFAADTRERYECERAFLQIGDTHGRTPQLIASSFDPGRGGYIVMTAVKGRVAADIHETLSAKDYAHFVRALGACMATVHAALPDNAAYPVPNNRVAERKAHFDAFPAVADRLKNAAILEEKAIPALAAAVSVARERAFASSRRLIHGDLHVWNILVDKRNGQPWCAMIDFEESAFSHVELDFVVPLISVLSQAFPGRRLARSWDAIWHDFVEGYASRSNDVPELELIIGHAVAWCLWGAVRNLDDGQSRYREFTGKALGAAALSGDRILARYATEAAK